MTIPGGTVHALSADMRKMLAASPKSLKTWEEATPLARNEWLCLVTSTDNPGTRARRLERARSQLAEGTRRPCCWAGCPHRADKKLSKTQEWVYGKKAKTASKKVPARKA